SHTTSAPSETSHSSPSSSPSKTSRWSRSSPSGHSRRKSSKVRWRQTTQPDRSIEPPGRLPFSSTTGSTPSSRALAAAQRLAIPAPATVSLFNVSRAQRWEKLEDAESAQHFQRRENEGLCSTYSTLTRSGPQTNTA